MFSILFDSRCSKHPGNGACEVPERIQWLREDVINKLNPSQWKIIQPEDDDEDIDQFRIFQMLRMVHTDEFLEEVINQSNFSGSMSDCNETRVEPGTLLAISATANCCMKAVDQVMSIEKNAFSFVACRPPSHHSGLCSTHGFCIVNNTVMTAMYALSTYPTKIKNVAIFDFDLHPANGSIDILESDHHPLLNQINVYSIHQRKIFPFISRFDKIKEDGPQVFFRSLAPRCPKKTFQKAFSTLIEQMQKQPPDLIVISCGFDACKDDLMSNLPVSAKDYKWMTELIVQSCPKVISCLEGGYVRESMSNCLAQHLNGAISTV